jgi:ribosomal protein L12E/L44/L45/RPP1/RPP2
MKLFLLLIYLILFYCVLKVGLGEAVEVTSPVTTVAEGAAVTEEEERERERGEEEEEDHQEDQESQNETGTGFALIQGWLCPFFLIS